MATFFVSNSIGFSCFYDFDSSTLIMEKTNGKWENK